MLIDTNRNVYVLMLYMYRQLINLQGGSKKVSCWHSTTAYYFWATLGGSKKV